MIKGYKNHYLLLIVLTAIISLLQIYLLEQAYTLLNFLNPFMGQLMGPFIFTAFLNAIFWYLGRNIDPKRVFYTFLFFWILIIVANFIYIGVYADTINKYY